MSGAWAAMQRVFSERAGDRLDADKAAALTDLAARVRKLAEAAMLTDVGPEETAAVAAEVTALTDRLTSALRAGPPLAQVDEDGLVRQLASPVTGVLNPVAPPVRIEVLPDRTARSEFTLSVLYEGPPGFVHGGVSALILDHLCGLAAAANGTPGMTVSLTMRYRQPTPHSVPLVAEARAVRSDGRKTFVEGAILGPEGGPTVEATAVLVMPAQP